MRSLPGTVALLLLAGSLAAPGGLGGQGAALSALPQVQPPSPPAVRDLPDLSKAAGEATALDDHWRRVEAAIMDGTAVEKGLLEEGDLIAMPPALRNADADPTHLWPHREVVIELANNEWPAMDKLVLFSALRDIERESCVRFVKRTNQTDYLAIKHNGRSCASIVGFHEGAGRVPTFLGRGCMRRGTIHHEMLHTLGIWHEHTRPDRDENIAVMWEHIVPGREFNFFLRPSDTVRTLGLPYDYSSVMHYRAVAFSKDGLPTILPREWRALPVMGQRIRFSRLDIAKLNTLYDCPAPYYRRENAYLDDALVNVLQDQSFNTFRPWV